MEHTRQDKLKTLSEIMRATGYAERTISVYVSFVRQVMEAFGTTRLGRISNEAIYSYSSKMKSDAARHQLLNALKCYFDLVDGNKNKIGKIQRPKRKETIPVVYAIGQINAVINSVQNIKHRTILYVLYGTGIRREELVNLKLSDINRSRNTLRVFEGKGGKTRETICDDFLLEKLEDYWKVCRPKQYLFEGTGGNKYSSTSVYNVIKRAFANQGLKASPHTLRHCFATHLLEADVSPRKVQKMMGHKRITTLEIYSRLVKIGTKSPLSLIEK